MACGASSSATDCARRRRLPRRGATSHPWSTGDRCGAGNLGRRQQPIHPGLPAWIPASSLRRSRQVLASSSPLLSHTHTNLKKKKKKKMEREQKYEEEREDLDANAALPRTRQAIFLRLVLPRPPRRLICRFMALFVSSCDAQPRFQLAALALARPPSLFFSLFRFLGRPEDAEHVSRVGWGVGWGAARVREPLHTSQLSMRGEPQH